MHEATSLLETAKLSRELEDKHELRSKDGKLRPTVDFLRDLARRLDLTTTQAWQTWRYTFDRLEAIRRKHEDEAELTFWYGVDAWRLDDERKAALRANLPRVQAQDTLHRGDFDPCDYGQAYALTLLATGDEKAALRARGDAIERLVESRSARR